MNYYPASITSLIQNISRLPGIGEKTAERLALHILRAPRQEAERLARSIMEIKTKTTLCTRCFGLSDTGLCRICSNPQRNHQLLCVIETTGDLVALEKSGAFEGVYLVLGGALSPIDGIGPEKLRIGRLMARVRNGEVSEVVLATSTSVEGEATAGYLADLLRNHPVSVTRIASGIPMGGDLKFVDQVTLRKAMEARRAL